MVFGNVRKGIIQVTTMIRKTLRNGCLLAWKMSILFEELLHLKWKVKQTPVTQKEFKIKMLQFRVCLLELRQLADSIDSDFVEMEINWWLDRHGDPGSVVLYIEQCGTE